VPSLKPFRDDIFHIGDVLVALCDVRGKKVQEFEWPQIHKDSIFL
jgi:hypothetical protein